MTTDVFGFLTTTPNAEIAKVHPKAMPVKFQKRPLALPLRLRNHFRGSGENKKMLKWGIAALAATALCGCASKSNEITAAYVSPVQYQNYNCQQLGMEAQAISQRAAIVSGAQDQKRTNDQLATAAAVVVFWPAAFFVGGDGPTAAELANLKGQLVAVEQASVMKRCNIQFQGQRPPGAGAEAQQPTGEFVCEDGSLTQDANACPAAPKRPAKNAKAKAKT